MKTLRLIIVLSVLVLSVLLVWGTPGQRNQINGAAADPVAAGSASAVDTPYVVVARGANERVWERTPYETTREGRKVGRVQRYTELASGLDYWEAGQWVESKEEIRLLADGTAAALQGQHQVYFPGNINEGYIELVTPEGKHLRSRPLGLSYDDGSNTVLIAELKDSVGQLVGPNQVIYADAFTDFKADLRYTYTRGGFEQDIILREQPLGPDQYGLNPATARLQLLTEFFDPPQPRVTRTRLPVQAGVALADEGLDFGATRMMPGRAFLLGSDGHNGGAAVGKSWVTLDGRQFLVEEVPVGALTEELGQLPAPATASVKGSPAAALHVVSARRLLPAPRLSKTGPGGRLRQMADNAPSGRGLVLDYQTVISGLTNYIFQGDTTYYISGAVNLYGTNTFEGGAVLKFATNGSVTITPGPPGISPGIIWQGGPYRPVIFTAREDNTVGQTVAVGSPAGYYGTPMLLLAGFSPPTAISNLRLSYANTAIQFGGVTANFYNVQFVNCQYGLALGGAHILLGNALFANTQTNFVFQGGSTLTAENVTFANSTLLATAPASQSGNSLFVTNSILCNVSNVLAGVYFQTGGAYNGFFNTPWTWNKVYPGNLYPFQTAGAGGYYLAGGSGFQGQGIASVIDPTLLAGLRAQTTYPPLVSTNVLISSNQVLTLGPLVPRDTNSFFVDLGYHYDPLDYLWSGISIGPPITLTNGVAVGFFGSLAFASTGGGFNSQGHPDALNHLVWYPSVQEEPVALGGVNTPGSALFTGMSGGAPKLVTMRFTDVAMLGLRQNFFDQCYSYSGPIVNLRDSSLRGINLSVNRYFYAGWLGSSVTLQNCRLERSTVSLSAGYVDYYGNGQVIIQNPLGVALYNNLFWNSSLGLANDELEATNPYNAYMTVKDNLFDTSTFTFTGDGNYASYMSVTNNAYNATADGYPVSSDLTLSNLTYATGTLGPWYIGSSSPTLLYAGSRSAAAAGLYHYTIEASQVPEGTNMVSIGCHYVATDGNGVPLDSDGDGIADYQEDANGNGVYDRGDASDWTDYYNGQLPRLNIVSGNNQSGPLGAFLPAALTVQVVNGSGSPLTNAPVTFALTNGLNELAPVINGPLSSNLFLRTDVNGYASAWLYLPTNAPITNLVWVGAQTGTNVAQVSFSATEGLVATPLITPGGGAYAVKQNVTISCATPGAVIHYTMNGNDPTESDLTAVNGQVVVLTNLTLKARAFADGLLLPSPVPSAAYVLTGAIAAGRKHTLALRITGDVLAGGSGGDGQLGDGTTHLRTNLVSVIGLSNVVGIAAGELFSYAWKSDGTVWALGWGDNRFGQLGNGATAHQQTTCVQVTNLTSVIAVAGGNRYGLALKSDGTVWAFGTNRFGQLGSGAFNQHAAPVQVTNLAAIVAIAAGGTHDLALKSNGTVWAWGRAHDGQLGDGTTPWYRTIPVQAALSANASAIAAGYFHSLALKTNGTVWAWGRNNYGQLGNGSTASQNTPGRVGNLSNVVAIAAGFYHSLALKSDGTVWAWGDNAHGQLGDCTTTNRSTPVPVSGLSNVVAIAAGGQHSVALLADGTLATWGYLNYGQELNFSSCPSVQEPAVRLTWLPPTIVTQPAGQTLFAGQNASFSVTATGVQPLNYQWLFNGNPLSDGNGVSGSQSATLTLNNIQATQGGNYSVVVGDGGGTVTSTMAVLTVNGPPVITQPLVDQAVYVGNSAAFTVAASGSGLTYQWQHNGILLSGQVSPTLTINNAQTTDAGNYSVTVANAAGQANAGAQLLTMGLAIHFPLVQITLSGNAPGLAYDVYGEPSLTGPAHNYRICSFGSPGQTVFNFPLPSWSSGFFNVGSATDQDGDGLTDGYEALVSKSNPATPFTLNDGLPDGWKAEWGLETSVPSVTNSPTGDPDVDGFNNQTEFNNGTDPWRPNSNPRPVVSIALVNGAFQISRSGASVANPLTVNYSIGGTAVINQDYTLSPAPGTFYPYSITIAAGAASTNLSFTPLNAASNTLVIGLVPYSLADLAPTNWTYVVDPFHDRTNVFFEGYMKPGQAGILINLYTNSQGYLQINDRTNTTPLPFVNVAKSNKGMVARIQISTNIALAPSAIIGQYYTAPNNNGNDSRTVVDRYGNVWVANRNDNTDIANTPLQPNGGQDHGAVTEFGIVIGGIRGYKTNYNGTTNYLGGTDYSFIPDPNGDYIEPPFVYNTCIDRDGDGLIHTSRGLDSLGVPDVLPWPNSTDVTNADDEMIVRYVRTIANGLRTIAFDTNNNIWVGGIGNNGLANWHELIDTGTGIPVTGQKLNPSGGGYGGLMDPFGVVWSVQNAGAMFTFTPSYSVPPAITAGEIAEPGIGFTAYGNDGRGNYGIGIDPTNGTIWSGVYGNADVYQYADNGSSSAWTIPDSSAQLKKGIAVDGKGNVWVAGADGGDKIFHLLDSGAYVGAIPLTLTKGTNFYQGSHPYGVSIDSQGMVWATCYYQDPNYSSNNTALGYYAMRIDPTQGATTTIGGIQYKVGQVVEVVDLGPNAQPYDLADETGYRSLNSPQPGGVWDFVQDSGITNRLWSSVIENANIPTGSSILTEVRAANRVTDLPSWPFKTVSGTAIPAGIKGRYLEVRLTLLRAFGNNPGPTVTNVIVLGKTTPGSGIQITNQPQSQMVFPGTNVTFGVQVSVPPGVTITSYQWRTNGVNVSNGGNISGATGPTLLITGVQYTNAARYSVRVTDSTGTVLDSVDARLHVMGNPPVVQQQPGIAPAPPYPPDTFFASAHVTPASTSDNGYQPVYYQWLLGPQPIAGASGVCTSAGNNVWTTTLTVPGLTCQNIGRYCVFFWNQYGEVLSQTVGNTAATNPTVNIASTTFTVHPTTGSGWTYQWYTNNPSGTRVAIGGATLNNLVVPTDSTGQGIGQLTYIVVANGTGGATASAQFEIQSNDPNGPSVRPDSAQNATVDIGFTAAGAGIAPITYQWYDNQGNPVGGNSASYTITSVDCTKIGNYQVRVTDACGNVTDPVYATVNFNPVVTIASTTFTAHPTTGSGWTYQWYTNNPSGTRVAIGGATSSTLTVPTDPTGQGIGQLTYIVVANGSGGATATGTIILTGNWPGGPSVQPDTEQNITLDVTFTAQQTEEQGIDTWIYQWYDNNGNPVGGNSPQYTITSVGCTQSATQSGSYRVQLYDTCNDEADAYPSLNQVANPTVTIASTIFTVHPTTGTGWTYQWYTNDPNGIRIAIGGATTASLMVPTDSTGQGIGQLTYILVANGSGGATATVQVEVLNNNPNGPNVQPDSAQNATMDVTFTAVGAGGGITYKWYDPSGNQVGTSAQYTISSVDCTKIGGYRAHIDDACLNSADVYANLSLSAAVIITSTTFTVHPITGTGWTYQWYTNDPNGIRVTIGGATSASLTVPTDPTFQGIGALTYTVIATGSGGATASAQMDLSGNWPSGPSITPDAVQNATWDLTFTAAQTMAMGIGIWTFQWYDNNGNPVGGNNQQYTITSANCTVGGYYRVQLYDTCNNEADAYPYLNASPSPVVNIASSTFTVHPTTGSGWTYQWYTNDPSGTRVAIGGATAASLTVPTDLTGQGIGQLTYILVANGSAGATASVQLEILNNDPSGPNVQPDNAQNATVDVTFTAAGSGTGITYQWFDNNGNPVSTSAQYTIAALGCPQGTTHGRQWGSYQVEVTDACLNSSSVYPYLSFNPMVAITNSILTVHPTTGSGWTYQWYTNNPSGTQVAIGGATGASYTVQMDPTGQGLGQLTYIVVASGSGGATANAQFEVQSSNPGGPSVQVDFTQNATVDLGYSALQTQGVGIGGWTYQWTDNHGAVVGSGTQYTITSIACAKTGGYRVQITDGCTDQTSVSGYLNVNEAVSIASMIFTLHPTTGSGWTYQWYTNNPSGTRVAIGGAMTASYTVPTDSTGQGLGQLTYIVVASGSGGASANAQFEVVDSNPRNASAQVDSTLNANVDVGYQGQTVGIGTWTYQWYNDQGTPVGSSSLYTIQSVNLADEGSYNLTATPDSCNSVGVGVNLYVQ